jgi:tetratricopeptide (TPR) repeat protein
MRTQIYGDVFVGRILDNEDDFKRLDFSLAELSSSAPWVHKAKAINLQRSNRSGAMEQQWVDMQAAAQQQRSQQPGASSSSSSSAEQEKLKGNAAFKKGDWQAALDHYTAALKLEPGMVAARNNRSLAYLKLGMAQQALDDCTAVLETEGDNIKALLRHAAAAQALGKLQEAETDLERVLQLQPGNKDAEKELQQVRAAGGSK